MRPLGRRRNWNTRRRLEVNFRAIPRLDPVQYVLLPAKELAIVGAAPKDFLIFGKRERPTSAYIAKAPTHVGPRECATEHIIASIGQLLPLRVAPSRLARLEPSPSGDEDVRFLSRYFLRMGQEQLVHGFELVASWLQSDPEELERAFGRRDRGERDLYTVDVLLEVLRDRARHGEENELIEGFGRMMAFDALLGVNDRHPLNWGVIRNSIEDTPLRFAPLFDSSRALFWSHSDAALKSVDDKGLRQDTIRRYADKSQPLIGFQRKKRTDPQNHFDVIDFMVSNHFPLVRQSVAPVIRAYDPDSAGSRLFREFGNLVSRRRLEYVDELLRYRWMRLMAMVS